MTSGVFSVFCTNVSGQLSPDRDEIFNFLITASSNYNSGKLPCSAQQFTFGALQGIILHFQRFALLSQPPQIGQQIRFDLFKSNISNQISGAIHSDSGFKLAAPLSLYAVPLSELAYCQYHKRFLAINLNATLVNQQSSNASGLKKNAASHQLYLQRVLEMDTWSNRSMIVSKREHIPAHSGYKFSHPCYLGCHS